MAIINNKRRQFITDSEFSLNLFIIYFAIGRAKYEVEASVESMVD